MFWTFQILPSISLLPSSFICKLNVGLTTSTYGGTMWWNIGWIEGSKRAPNRIQFVERSVVQRALKRAPDRIQFFKRSEVQRALKELPITKSLWDDRRLDKLSVPLDYLFLHSHHLCTWYVRILCGEILSWSFMGVKGSKDTNRVFSQLPVWVITPVNWEKKRCIAFMKYTPFYSHEWFQDRISPYNINTVSIRHVVRIKKTISLEILIQYQILWTNIIRIVWV